VGIQQALWVANDGDPLWDNVVLLVQGGSAVDQSNYARALTLYRGTENDSTWVSNGSNTIELDSSIVYGTPLVCGMYFNDAAELVPGAQDFCFEGWVQLNSAQVRSSYYYRAPGSWGFGPTDNVIGTGSHYYTINVTLTTLAALEIEAPQAYYYCAERVGGTIYFSLDGVVLGTYNFAVSTDPLPTPTGGQHFIGMDIGISPNDLFACIGQTRYTMGANRYGGSNFTPPDSLFPVG